MVGGYLNGRLVISAAWSSILPATEWIQVVSSASSRVSGGMIAGIRFAYIVFPDPGGPIIIILFPPATKQTRAGNPEMTYYNGSRNGSERIFMKTGYSLS